MKSIILYFSSHHGNTKKLVDAIAATGVETLDVSKSTKLDLNDYDVIGIASGIYGGSFGKPILSFLEKNLPGNKKVFLIYTCAKKLGHYTNAVRKIVDAKGCQVIGDYSCPGYNTFGPFKLVGGTAKGHPTKEEIEAAVDSWRNICTKIPPSSY